MGNWINICFVIDESGSMYSSIGDVTGGFQKIIDEQKKNKDGKVTISLYTFSDNTKVRELYRNVDINDIAEFVYNPGGLTALYDGVGTAIDNIGKWLSDRDKNHEEMPAKTMFVIMTDGMENNSKEYKLADIQAKIKEQTEVYSWEFVYVGTDLTDTKQGDSLGVKNQFYATKNKLGKTWDALNFATSCYRLCATMDEASMALSENLNGASKSFYDEYEQDTGLKLRNDDGQEKLD